MEENIPIKEIQQLMEKDFSFSCPDEVEGNWFTAFTHCVNDMIEHDFPKLVAILYRSDINEEKLKQLLRADPSADAGKIIGELIIERQLQKIKSREMFGQHRSDMDENEKW